MNVTTARDRAEELLHSLQKRAREIVDAEDGLIKTARDLVEQGIAPQDVKKRLEELMEFIKTNRIVDGIKNNETVVALNDYRGEIERKADEHLQKFLGSLQIASRTDIAELQQQIKELNKKVSGLAKKGSHSAASQRS